MTGLSEKKDFNSTRLSFYIPQALTGEHEDEELILELKPPELDLDAKRDNFLRTFWLLHDSQRTWFISLALRNSSSNS